MNVVVVHELGHEDARVLDGPEPVREHRTVLQLLEHRFGVRVVIRDVRTGQGPGDLQAGQKRRERLGRHRRAVIRMNDAGHHATVGADRGVHEVTGQRAALAGMDFPVDDLAEVDGDDHVCVEPDPAGRAGQLGDVPGEHLLWAAGQQGRDGSGAGAWRPPVVPEPAGGSAGSGTSWTVNTGSCLRRAGWPAPAPAPCPRTGHHPAPPAPEPAPRQSAPTEFVAASGPGPAPTGWPPTGTHR